MDSFELNKVIGAILGTCLVFLVTSFAAGALFAPQPAKRGFEIAVKEEAHAPAERRRPRRPSRSRSCCRPLPSRRAPPPRRSAPPVTTSKRAGPTGPARISTGSSTRRAKARAAQFLAAMKAQGRRTEHLMTPTNSSPTRRALFPVRRWALGHSEGQRARRRDCLFEFTRRQARPFADGGKITFQNSGI